MFHNFFIHVLLKSKPINQIIDLSHISKNIDFCYFLASILDTILNISKCSMMPKWHHLDFSRAMSA